jgi:hypothetical protein
MWSAKSADPYVVVSPAVSSRSLTATGTPAPGGGSAGRASQIPSLLEMEVQERHPDGAGEEEQEDAEQRPAEANVPARELGIHQMTASTASAAKSSAR